MSDELLSRTLRAVRHLRFSQLLSRLKYQIERRSKPNPNRYRFAGPGAPPLRGDLPALTSLRPGNRENFECAARGSVNLLNLEREIGYDKIDWSLGPCTQSRLWTVTLHYHRWLSDLARLGDRPNAETAALCQHYLADWIAHCALDASGARELVWNSYAIATRIAEWISIHTSLSRAKSPGWSDFEPTFLASLYQQAAYLHKHLEYDLRANHLMRDAVGLAWAGRFFEGATPRAWLETATRLAVEQSREQVLPDGGHFERSPMYHLEVMHDVYSLAKLLEDSAAKTQLIESWSRMAEFAAWMRHPDGQIPLLNDAAFNGTDSPAEMLALGKELNVACDVSLRSGGKFFTDAGLVVWHGEPWSIFFDVGEIGPDYQPGHGHADTLSLECSFKGARLFVDPGTHSYDLDDRRRYERSTAAHNTVCIDGEDSSEVWHIFRVGRRAYPLDIYADFAGGRLNVSAGHDGYRHLSGRPRPFRRVELGADKLLSIEDRIEGGGKHRLSGGWLLHPAWSATGSSNGWELKGPAGLIHVTVEGPIGLKYFERRCPYHPEFGLEQKTTRLCWTLDGTALPITITTRVQ